MVNKIICLIILLMFLSCGLPYRRLDNGNGNKVPKENYTFRNQNKFNSTLYNEAVDTSYFYALLSIYGCDKKFAYIVNARMEKDPTKRVLQFYKNGQVRLMNINFMKPSPEIEGSRGIVYFKKKEMYFDFFWSGSDHNMRISTSRIKINGDTLIMRQEDFFGLNKTGTCWTGKKENKIPENYKEFKANW